MLAQILKDMWVEPELLSLLSEEQRRTLFLKMREEQVRRWREREGENETRLHARPRTAGHGKRVRWLRGRDGDVCVHVIGEADQFRSSKLLKTLHNRLQGADVNGLVSGVQSASLLQRETRQPGIQLLPNGDSVTRCHDASKHSEEEDGDSGSAEDDPKKDPREDGSDSDSGSGADDPKDWGTRYRTRPRSAGSLPPLSSQLSITDQLRPQDRGPTSPENGENEENEENPENTENPENEENPENGENPPAFGRHVARLRTAFAGTTSTGGPLPPSRPRLPRKPQP